MCGIGGFSGRFDPSLLERMGAVIRHRGPDDADSLYLPEERVGLVHRRLSIIDLSAAGRQPMWDATRTVCIVYNGEVYNYRELRHELERDRFEFLNNTDTEVILNLYLRYGVEMLPRLNGIFAFALWDSRSRSLLLARDGLGVKPFYYARTGDGLVFASELKAVLQSPSVSRALDIDAVRQYTRFLWCPAPQTILQNVRKLVPGHAAWVADGEIIKSWQYYDLPFDEEPYEFSDADAIAATRDVIAAAVERQMVADVPVGAFLSGGLDSSAVVAFAREHEQAEPLRCFTIGFSEGKTASEGVADDLPYARRAARHLGVELDEVTVGPATIDDLASMVYQLDEPQADLAPLNVGVISRAARQAGIKVLLSGAGGDDIFSGYRRHQSLQLEPAWSWLPYSARAALRGLSRRVPTRHPTLRRAVKVFSQAHRSSDDRIASYFYWLDPEQGDSLFEGDALRDARPASGDALLDCVQSLPVGMPRLNKMLYLDTKFFLPDHNLNYTDKMSMAHGVEVRVPLLDYEVVRHAGRLRVEDKQRGPTTKWVFRKAMEGILPRDVIYRPKAGFGVPLREWMAKGLMPLVDEVLSERSLAARGIFAPASVRRLIDLDRRGAIDAAYPILSMACIELWCRAFLS
ncbi:MAG TPA: asparagine synthase (glutamine-hydrolyzing) [Gemmatimonadaceae bacterium]|jgi:asparagine synthase (glutamine-hydrolysing)|nr:asparagine synthase (glutamine-hydrolyzing) [Gemmatimonadaceae bacterium]